MSHLYLLVNVYITMEFHHSQWEHSLHQHFYGHFPLQTTTNYQRVKHHSIPLKKNHFPMGFLWFSHVPGWVFQIFSERIGLLTPESPAPGMFGSLCSPRGVVSSGTEEYACPGPLPVARWTDEPGRNLLKISIYSWLVVTVVFLEHDWIIFPYIFGMSSSQLTNSYFSEG